MSDPNSQKHSYSKIILAASWIAAVLGGIAGLCLIIFFTNDARESVGAKKMYYAPFIFGAIGYLVGMAFAFLFAPESFLESESGKKWLERVGTKSTVSARVVCAIVAGLATALFVAIAVAFINER